MNEIEIVHNELGVSLLTLSILVGAIAIKITLVYRKQKKDPKTTKLVMRWFGHKGRSASLEDSKKTKKKSKNTKASAPAIPARLALNHNPPRKVSFGSKIDGWEFNTRTALIVAYSLAILLTAALFIVAALNV